jgi:cyclophilin family peptidyl-prolyl cis-trans isomerase
MKTIIALFLALAVAPMVSAQDPEVLLQTSHGEITLRLHADQAPITVANFLGYVDTGFFDGTIFHRVIPGFMIQGGGMTAQLEEKPNGEPIKNEAKNRLHNERGTVAMARTNDPDSATNQFFINVRSNFRLDWAPSNPGYTVFGVVTKGMDVVDAIAVVETGNVPGHQNVPLEPVMILEARRVNVATTAE